MNVPDCDVCEQCFTPMPFSSERFCSDQCEVAHDQEIAGLTPNEEYSECGS